MRTVRRSRVPGGAACVTPFTMRELAGRRNLAITGPSVGARLGRDRLDVARQGVQMHGAVVEAGTPRPLDPHERVLESVTVVGLREVLGGVGAAALGAIRRRVDGGRGLQQQVLELERLDEIGVPDERAVGDAYVGEGSESRPDPLDPLRETLAAAKYRRIQLHGLLHLQADRSG